MSNRSGASIAALVALLTPIAMIVAFCAALCAARPRYVADEISHYPAIQAILRGDWAATRWLPMPPAYHAIAAGASYVVGQNLVALRWFNAALGIGCVLIMGLIARRAHPGDAAVPARAALNPLFISLCPLVYTDVLSLLCVLIAISAHERRGQWAAGIALVCAMLVRQSNVVWPLLFLILPAADALDAGQPGALRAMLRSAWRASRVRDAAPYIVALALGAAMVLVPNPLTSEMPEGNEPRFNVGLFYIWAITGAILWLPVWLAGCVHSPWLARTGARASLLALAVAAFFVLSASFDSPHGWNTDPTSLRNWPLLAMQRSKLLVLVTCLALVPMLIETLRRTWDSGRRHRLLAIWTTSLLFLAPHSLVDPRYFLIPAVLLDLDAPLAKRESRDLAVWYGVLSLATIAMMLVRPGGVIHL